MSYPDSLFSLLSHHSLFSWPQWSCENQNQIVSFLCQVLQSFLIRVRIKSKILPWPSRWSNPSLSDPIPYHSPALFSYSHSTSVILFTSSSSTKFSPPSQGLYIWCFPYLEHSLIFAWLGSSFPLGLHSDVSSAYRPSLTSQSYPCPFSIFFIAPINIMTVSVYCLPPSRLESKLLREQGHHLSYLPLCPQQHLEQWLVQSTCSLNIC